MRDFLANSWLDLLYLASCFVTGMCSLWLYRKADQMRDRCDIATLPFCYRDAMAPAMYGIVITGLSFALDALWLAGEGGEVYQEAFQYNRFRVMLIVLGLLVNHFLMDQIRRGRNRIRRACNRECDRCFEAAMGRGRK